MGRDRVRMTHVEWHHVLPASRSLMRQHNPGTALVPSEETVDISWLRGAILELLLALLVHHQSGATLRGVEGGVVVQL